jgi:hypothetical protein
MVTMCEGGFATTSSPKRHAEAGSQKEFFFLYSPRFATAVQYMNVHESMRPSPDCQGTGKSSRIWKTGKLVTIISYDLLESGTCKCS